MRELSLFSGAGGGLLASRLLGWRAIGYVEDNEYCQRVLRARIDDGYLDDAPIFGDIRAFLGEGYADSYQGMVDVVSAGFPCQAYSTAARGRQRAERDLWPETFQAIAHVQPRYVFAESPSRKAIERAGIDLEALGYMGSGATVSAAAVGAPHKRERFWLLADAYCEGEPRFTFHEKMACLRRLPKMDLWENQPDDLGMDDGVAHRMDRLRALGNGQVASVARAAWELLS